MASMPPEEGVAAAAVAGLPAACACRASPRARIRQLAICLMAFTTDTLTEDLRDFGQPRPYSAGIGWTAGTGVHLSGLSPFRAGRLDPPKEALRGTSGLKKDPGDLNSGGSALLLAAAPGEC